jgi:Leucine-rich repeat (LRR) protein
LKKNLIPSNKNNILALGRTKSLLNITNKLLANKNSNLVDDSWIDRLWEWADKNGIGDLEWIENSYHKDGGDWQGLPRIKEKLLKIKIIYLPRKHVNNIPIELFKLVQIEKLILDLYGYSSIPKEIENLKKLEFLEIQEGDNIHIPKEILLCKQIKSVKLYGNNNNNPQVNQYVENIFYLNKLEELVLYGIGLEKLPSSIKKLKQLKILDIGGDRYFGYNNIQSLPQELEELENLEELNLWDSGFEGLPKFLPKKLNIIILGANHSDGCNGTMSFLSPNISKLYNLSELHIPSNQLEKLPKEICELINLTKLNLFSNELIKLPNEITNLTNLIEIDLKYNSNLILTKEQKEWIKELKNNGCNVLMDDDLLDRTDDYIVPINEDEIPF